MFATIRNKLSLSGGFSQREIEKCLRQASEHAGESEAHRLLAGAYAGAGRWFPAIAEYRTALALNGLPQDILLPLAKAYLKIGLIELAVAACKQCSSLQGRQDSPEVKTILKEAETARPRPLVNLPVEWYSRLKRLADHVLRLNPGGNFSLLDVGGGEGVLSLFMPSATYALAEPNINGISGMNLPFADKFFDTVVSCHVLEHIPPDGRAKFLEQLCAKAAKNVLLLNPFEQPGGHDEERLKLIIGITGAAWAKEHLDCSLPKIEDVQQFAASRNFECKIHPMNSRATILALVFLGHYAALAGRQYELEKINSFFNSFLHDGLTNEKNPNDYLLEIIMENK